MATLDALASWTGLTVIDPNGQTLGWCRDVFTDADSGAAEWLLISAVDDTARVVPVGGARLEGDRVRVGFAEPDVMSGPVFGATQVLTPEDEAGLYGHYDLALPSADVLREAAATAAEAGDRPEGAASTRRRAVVIALVLTVLTAGVAVALRRRSALELKAWSRTARS